MSKILSYLNHHKCQAIFKCTIYANMHVLFKFPCKLNLTDINASLNCLIISPKDMNNSSLSLSHHLAMIIPSIVIPSLSHGKANAIKSNVRKTIALNDMFVACSSPPPPPPLPLALYTRLPFNYALTYTHTCMHVYVHP